MVNGYLEKEKEKVYKLLQIIVSIKAIGRVIRLMAKGKLYLQMGMYSKGNGFRIRPMDLESIFIAMGPFIKDIGNRICRMGRGFRLGPMEANTRDSTKMVRNMVRGYTYGQTVAIIQVHGMKIKSMDMESTSGSMDVSMLDSGD